MDYTSKTLAELKAICKARKITRYSKLNRGDLIDLLQEKGGEGEEGEGEELATQEQQQDQQIIHGDTIAVLPTLPSDSAQIIIADPPYNIGKDFGNDSDKQPMDEYLKWCDIWIKECIRILKPNGTMFIQGFLIILIDGGFYGIILTKMFLLLTFGSGLMKALLCCGRRIRYFIGMQ